MKHIKLPSGAEVLDLLEDVQSTTVESNSNANGIESTSGTLSLDMPDTCPKCLQQMRDASAIGEPVYYCVNCRVTTPKTVS